MKLKYYVRPQYIKGKITGYTVWENIGLYVEQQHTVFKIDDSTPEAVARYLAEVMARDLNEGIE